MPASPLCRTAGLVLALALPAVATAIELRPEFQSAIEQGIANGRYQSVAVGLLDDGEQSQWLFGAVEPGGAKPTADTVYEIGSTTRCFTGLLLADAVLAGKLRLDDTLGKIFADVHFADPKLAATTLGEIAAHRAGLPAIASNLFPRNVDDPYVTFDAAALKAYLAHAQVDGAGTYRYSELGVAVLGEAAARVHRKDYRSLVASEVLAPHAVREKLVIASEAQILCPSMFAQSAIATYFASMPWREQIKTFREIYRERRDALLAALTDLMPAGTRWTRPEGGFYVWLTLPEGLHSKEMLPRAIAARVAYVPGTGFFADGSGGSHMRLSYCFPTPERIREGVRRLATVVEEEMKMRAVFGTAAPGAAPGVSWTPAGTFGAAAAHTPSPGQE